jgi:hypothetical protein
MKKGKQINIKINFSNRWLYTFIVFGILIVAGIGVYAYNTGSPTTSGHTWNEIAGIPAGFADGVDNQGISSCSASFVNCAGYSISGNSFGTYRGCPDGKVMSKLYESRGAFTYAWCCSISISCA